MNTLRGGAVSEVTNDPVLLNTVFVIGGSDNNQVLNLNEAGIFTIDPADGVVWTWGANYLGQLGDGTTVSRETPSPLASLSNVIAIAAPMDSSMALMSDGTVWQWGSNNDGATLPPSAGGTYNTIPTLINGLNNITAITGGWFHSMALRTDGTIWTWGNNWYGQLGDGTTTYRGTPVMVTGIPFPITTVAGGAWHSLALDMMGNVWAWGDNHYGQLGNGTYDSSLYPVQAIGLSNVVAIAAGFDHSVAIKTDGTVWTWGYYGDTPTFWSRDLGFGRNIPTQVTGLSNIQAIAGGGWHTAALDIYGNVWTWGLNSNGQLGDGTYTFRNTPMAVFNNASAIAAKCFRTVALKSDGTVWTWGQAYTSQSTVPVQKTELSGVSAIASGMDHTIILTGIGGDITPPTGTITINSGAVYTNSTSVTLTLTCTDYESGCSQMKFSNDNVTYTTPESYATSKAWTLTSGDGIKTVYVKFKDNAGNWSGAYSDSITLDTTAPTGSITINSGATYTNSVNVTLTLSASDTGSGVSQMRFSNDNVTWSSWEIFTTSKSWTLTGGDGTKTVYVQYKDAAGNTSAIYSDSIILDATPPTGTIIINSGAAYTNTTSVTLLLSCTDLNGCSQMQFSNDNITWTTPETYATSKTWTLTSGDGEKTVYVKFKDNAGNWSGAYSDTITLDTIAPTGSIIINSGATYTTDTAVTLTLSCTDTGSGCYQMRFSNDDATWTEWEAYVTTKAWTLTNGEGTKTVYVQYKDNAENSSISFSDDIILLPIITVTLVPDSTIIPRGGTLGYTVTVTNNTATSQTFQYWSYVRLPNGNRYPPTGGELYGTVTVTLNPGQTRSAHLTHGIPNNAPLGTYTYYGNVGPYPTIWDSDSFQFTVTATISSQDKGVKGWELLEDNLTK